MPMPVTPARALRAVERHLLPRQQISLRGQHSQQTPVTSTLPSHGPPAPSSVSDSTTNSYATHYDYGAGWEGHDRNDPLPFLVHVFDYSGNAATAATLGSWSAGSAQCTGSLDASSQSSADPCAAPGPPCQPPPYQTLPGPGARERLNADAPFLIEVWEGKTYPPRWVPYMVTGLQVAVARSLEEGEQDGCFWIDPPSDVPLDLAQLLRRGFLRMYVDSAHSYEEQAECRVCPHFVAGRCHLPAGADGICPAGAHPPAAACAVLREFWRASRCPRIVCGWSACPWGHHPTECHMPRDPERNRLLLQNSYSLDSCMRRGIRQQLRHLAPQYRVQWGHGRE
eukprot:gene17948-6216_t